MSHPRIITQRVNLYEGTVGYLRQYAFFAAYWVDGEFDGECVMRVRL